MPWKCLADKESINLFQLIEPEQCTNIRHTHTRNGFSMLQNYLLPYLETKIAWLADLEVKILYNQFCWHHSGPSEGAPKKGTLGGFLVRLRVC